MIVAGAATWRSSPPQSPGPDPAPLTPEPQFDAAGGCPRPASTEPSDQIAAQSQPAPTPRLAGRRPGNPLHLARSRQPPALRVAGLAGHWVHEAPFICSGAARWPQRQAPEGECRASAQWRCSQLACTFGVIILLVLAPQIQPSTCHSQPLRPGHAPQLPAMEFRGLAPLAPAQQRCASLWRWPGDSRARPPCRLEGQHTRHSVGHPLGIVQLLAQQQQTATFRHQRQPSPLPGAGPRGCAGWLSAGRPPPAPGSPGSSTARAAIWRGSSAGLQTTAPAPPP